MDYKDLCESIHEAERFLKKAKVAKDSASLRKGTKTQWYDCDDGVANGACLRASMDLTRSLANLRHPWREK